MSTPLIFAVAAYVAASLQSGTPAQPVTVAVRYGDLDLTSAKGQGRLKHRIESAASWICAEVTSATPAPASVNPECFRETTKDALAQMARAVARASNGNSLATVATLNQLRPMTSDSCLGGQRREDRKASLSIVGFVCLTATTGAVAATSADDAKIRALQQRQAAAWNAHDIDAYAALFTPDANVVNVLGWHWRSRAELDQKLGRAFRFVFARSYMTIAGVSVELLKQDVAVAHVRWTMTGALSPTGSGANIPQRGIQTQVLIKRGGFWHIRDLQNTNSIPENDFPLSAIMSDLGGKRT